MDCSSPAKDAAAPREPAAGTVTAFGLDLRCDSSLLFIERSAVAPTGRPLEISLHPTRSLELSWPASAELLCEDRRPDGGLIYEIASHPEAGYLITGPEYGAFRLSGDGRRLRCAPGGRAEGVWQRLLIAQVLPFAAVLQGLEVFHASAVVRHGRAIALLGPSGAGKTSVALALCDDEASFLADDVVALEARAGTLVAHPGMPIAGVDRTEAQRRERAGNVAGGSAVAINDREHLLRVTGATEPAPLAGLFLLDRRADGPSHPRFETPGGAQALLAGTFNFVLATPRRLLQLLDVCALAARLHVERVVVGPVTSASEVALAIERRLSSAT